MTLEIRDQKPSRYILIKRNTNQVTRQPMEVVWEKYKQHTTDTSGKEINYIWGIWNGLTKDRWCAVLLKDEHGFGRWSSGGNADGRREVRVFQREDRWGKCLKDPVWLIYHVLGPITSFLLKDISPRIVPFLHQIFFLQWLIPSSKQMCSYSSH